MKRYKILKARSPEHAEELMNDMAKAGWTVAATCVWSPLAAYQLLITFERDIQTT